MSSQLDPEVGRDDPSPHAPKSADLDDENSSAPKESSGQADEHRAMAPSLSCRWRDCSTTPVNGWTTGPRRNSHP
jgi:hypothetical protein